MNPAAGLFDHDRRWDAILLIMAAAALLLNGAGLLFGSLVPVPLLFIPVVLAAYRYPKRGIALAGGYGGVFVLMAVILPGNNPSIIALAFVSAIVMVAIGWLTMTLTFRLREQEDLYQGLFEHSESGGILVADTGTARIIEAANWMASDLLHRTVEDLRGTSLSAVWSGSDEEEFFSRLSRGEAVYAKEASFLLPDKKSFIVLVSAAPLPGSRAILTFVDITDRVRAEDALKTANDKLGLLSRISADHLHEAVDRILETADEADALCTDTGIRGSIDRIRTLAWDIARHLFLTESYKDLGTSAPVWVSVRQAFESARLVPDTGQAAIRIWAERLEVYGDPLIADVLIHLVENSIRYGGTTKNIVVTYQETPDGLDLLIRDDGIGIPDDRKERIFEYDAGAQAGIGLFICRQIAEVTGLSLNETGIAGRGACFVLHAPPGRYRIEGSGDDAPPLPLASAPALHAARHRTGVTVRELPTAEFPVAAALWADYHHTTGDPLTDRIFAAFLNGRAVSVARCRRHTDGFEVDGVFTPDEFRGHGYANAAVWGLVEACGSAPLYMHSVRHLEKFYGSYGFVPIDEKELPPTIRERYAWAQGEMEGADVLPMKRVPTETC